MKNVLIINGALGGLQGNTQQLLKSVEINFSAPEFHITHLELKTVFSDLNDNLAKELLVQTLDMADGIIFATGTHWDSWSSCTQRFLELMTDYEATSTFLGKPVCVIVTMHSVGGKSVLSRLQGVFNTFGMMVPPMSGFVYSLVNQIALTTNDSHHEDLWSLEDLKPITHNFKEALLGTHLYKTWPVDIKDPNRLWIKKDEN